jgi:hypothetical protein
VSKKLISLFLTLVALLAAAPARATAAEELTEDEAREARELAKQFEERISETGDVGPLVSDLFVADFAERLRHEREQTPMKSLLPRQPVR